MTASPESSVDGRRARGQRRRAAIIAATLAVVERDGAAGVTHRSVADHAGVPASSVTYHFASLDDLLVAALTGAADEYATAYRQLRDTGRGGLQAIAELTVAAGGDGRRRAVAERELTLLAVRRPALRPIAGHWRDLVAAVAAEHTDDPIAITATVTTADGACAQVMLSDTPLTVPEVRELLERALHG